MTNTIQVNNKNLRNMRSKEEIEEICKKSMSYDYINGFTNSAYIDANDGLKWRVAQIISSTATTVDIHYEAWASRCNESGLPKRLTKLAPFRFNSLGYTGQAKQPFREFAYQKETNLEIKNSLQRIIDSNFNAETLEMNAMKFSQYVRGDVFIYADSLLSISYYYEPTTEQLAEIFDFFAVLFKIIIKWIEHFPSLTQEYYAAHKHPYLYLIDFNTSVAMCYPELVELLKTSFGENPIRTSRSFCVFYISKNRNLMKLWGRRMVQEWLFSGSSLNSSKSRKDWKLFSIWSWLQIQCRVV